MWLGVGISQRGEAEGKGKGRQDHCGESGWAEVPLDWGLGQDSRLGEATK